jgi:hypothetical protein
MANIIHPNWGAAPVNTLGRSEKTFQLGEYHQAGAKLPKGVATTPSRLL